MGDRRVGGPRRRCGALELFGICLLLVIENHGKSLSAKKQVDYVDENSCLIQINGGLAEPQPLILCPDRQGQHDFVYPVESGVGHLVAEAGQSLRIACPGSRFNISRASNFDDTLVTCIGGNNFALDKTNLERSFDKIACEKYPSYTARLTGERCGTGVKVEIGFALETPVTKKQKRQEFHRLIDLCHDEALGNTLYAHAKILASIDAAQTSFSRTAFRKGKFFKGIQMSAVYGRDTQRETIARILGSDKLADRYIPETGARYFARGHLIAKSDFIYGSHQRTTFFYVNVVPMWQNINAGNWGRMESNVRAYASKKDLDLDVWVGGLDVLTLKDAKGRDREIYLSVDENNNRAVPVPKILFKVVYNYPTKSGIVFLTANNPYLDSLDDEYRICNDICDKIHYMTWNRTNPDRGLSYCCEIDDFRRIYPNIPCLDAQRLLL